MISRVNKFGFPKTDLSAKKHKLFQFEFGTDTAGVALIRFDLDLYTGNSLYSYSVSLALRLGSKTNVSARPYLLENEPMDLKFRCRSYSKKNKNPGYHVTLDCAREFQYRIQNVEVYEPTGKGVGG